MGNGNQEILFALYVVKINLRIWMQMFGLIGSLNSAPTAALEWERRTSMRLVDLDVLKAQLNKLPMMSNWGEAFIPQLIDEQPTIDAVPVVRCQECRYYPTAKVNEKGFLICPASGMEITETDYCSYGERMDKEDET